MDAQLLSPMALDFLLALDEAARSHSDPSELAGLVVKALAGYLRADLVAYVELEDPGHNQGLAETHGEYSDDLRSLAAIPLREGEALQVILLVGAREPRDWTPSEVELALQSAVRCRYGMRQARIVRRARESEERLRLIMSNVRDHAIFILDPEGRVTEWNIGAEQIFGWTAEEMTGHRADRIFTPEDLAQQRQHLELAMAAEGKISDNERYHMRADGSRFFTTGSLEALRDEQGELRGFVKVVRDVSDKKRIEEEREQVLLVEKTARAEAERVGRMKDEFLATLSHELRTPLTSILGWAQLLGRKSAALPDELRNGVGIIYRNARTQAQLIDDLLDMNRIVAGNLRIELEELEPELVLRATLDVVEPMAKARGVQLEVGLQSSVGLVRGDSSRLQQILWNLLHNAIKFTAEGGVVRIALQREADQVLFRVSDTGQGLAAHFLPHVFERFRQADASTTRRHGGLGLGLSIVKQLVELHQGRVWAESEGEGCGSTFTVALPALLLAEATPPPTDAAPDPRLWAQLLRGVRVMVVEDEPDTLELLEQLLSMAGAEVMTTRSAERALILLQSSVPDVLVSDIGMPDLDGYTFIRRVRQLPAEGGGGVPAIALTAFARAEDRQLALDAGYQLHIAKPLEPDELVTGIRRLVSG